MSEKRLLVIDDEPDFRRFAEQVAQGLGYEVTVCDESLHAIASYERTLDESSGPGRIECPTKPVKLDRLRAVLRDRH